MAIAAIGKELNNINALAGAAPPRVVQAIQQASAKTGVDFAYLLQKAATESSLNPTAQAKTSSARGLYQFVNQTWLDTLDKHAADHGRADLANAITRTADGRAVVADPKKRAEILALRDNPELAAGMAAELAADNAARLQKSAGKNGGKVGGTELYLAHFLGAGGANALLTARGKNPNASAAALLPEAAAANRSVFYSAGGRARTVDDVYNRFAAKFNDVSSSAVAALDKNRVAVAGGSAVIRAARGDLSALPVTQNGARVAVNSVPTVSPLNELHSTLQQSMAEQYAFNSSWFLELFKEA